MFLNDAAFGIEHERSGKRGDTAVLEANDVGSESDGIVDAEFFSEFLDGVLIVIVHYKTKNLETVFVFVLEFDEVGDFGAARSAPSSPEIEEGDFAAGIGERDRFAIEAGELEVRRWIGIANEADRGLLLLGSGEGRNETKK